MKLQKSSGPTCIKQKFGPKEFTLGFMSKEWKNRSVAYVASHFCQIKHLTLVLGYVLVFSVITSMHVLLVDSILQRSICIEILLDKIK